MRSTNSTFRWLNYTQFLGALNDNIFKFLIIFHLIAQYGNDQSSTITGVAGIIFVVPFLLFSHASGILADRKSKQKIIFFTKIIEIFIMIFGAAAFALGNPLLLYTVLFLMAVQSTLFSPSKFGIIPELVSREKISEANGALSSFTFLAIIMGTIAAPVIWKNFQNQTAYGCLICITIAVAGAACSTRIHSTTPKGSRNQITFLFFRDIWNTVKFAKKDPYLLGAMLGCSFFWVIGAFVQINIIPYGIQVLAFSAENSVYLFLVTALGIAAGSWVAGRLSGRNIEFGIVPIGALGLTISCIGMRFVPHGNLLLTCLDILVMGISAGLFIIPLEAFVQVRSPENRRGEIIATNNFLNFVGILFASALTLIFTHIFYLSAAQGFFVVGLLTLALLFLYIKILPDFLVRFIVLIITRVFYRLRKKGIDHIPADGPALLVSNHTAWVDPFLIQAASQRRIRFLIFRKYYENKWLRSIARLMGTIPIAADDPPHKLIQSLNKARVALDDGLLVCIFADGEMTKTENIDEFMKGAEQIIKDRDDPIIPIYIGGSWDRFSSVQNGPPPTSFQKNFQSSHHLFQWSHDSSEFNSDYKRRYSGSLRRIHSKQIINMLPTLSFILLFIRFSKFRRQPFDSKD